MSSFCRRQAGRFLPEQNSRSGFDAKNLAETLDGNSLLRRIDETEPHRLPSLAKKSRGSLQDLAFPAARSHSSRRNPLQLSRQGPPAVRAGGALRSFVLTALVEPAPQRPERPTPRSLAISLCVRPLTSTNRTASAAEFLPFEPSLRLAHEMLLLSLQKSSPLFPRQVQFRRHQSQPVDP